MNAQEANEPHLFLNDGFDERGVPLVVLGLWIGSTVGAAHGKGLAIIVETV